MTPRTPLKKSLTMNILITGGAGFIGSALARALILRGHYVTVLDNLSPQIHGENPNRSSLLQSLPPSVSLIKADVRSRSDWMNALAGQQAVLHLAAETGTGQSMYEIERYADVNVLGTALMLDILAKGERSVDSIVLASSRAIYGEGRYQGANGYVYPASRSPADMAQGRFECYADGDRTPLTVAPTDEESQIHPSSIYGITKQVQEQMVLTACAGLGIRSVALRYQNVYGPGQSLRNPYTGILSIFSTLLLSGRDLDIFEDGKESRDFVYIDDVVAATVLALESKTIDAKAYNVGSGVQTTVLEVAETLRTKYHAEGRINVSGRFRIGDIRHNFADLTRVRKDLGFVPIVNFAEGVSRFALWVSGQHIEDVGYDRSLDELKSRGLLK
jgi:dTDP-L-rhamnose 4-epimerase